MNCVSAGMNHGLASAYMVIASSAPTYRPIGRGVRTTRAFNAAEPMASPAKKPASTPSIPKLSAPSASPTMRSQITSRPTAAAPEHNRAISSMQSTGANGIQSVVGRASRSRDPAVERPRTVRWRMLNGCVVYDLGWRMGWDSNPRIACAIAGFQVRCIQPLCHPSIRSQAYTARHHAMPLDEARPADTASPPAAPNGRVAPTRSLRRNWSCRSSCARPCGPLDDRAYRHAIARYPETRDDAGRDCRDERAVVDRLAPVNVAEMHLDDGTIEHLQCIHDRDRRERIARRIDDDPARGINRLLDPIDELAFRVGLAKDDFDRACVGATRSFDVGERRRAIDQRLSRAKPVQIRSVEDVDRHGDRELTLVTECVRQPQDRCRYVRYDREHDDRCDDERHAFAHDDRERLLRHVRDNEQQ